MKSKLFFNVGVGALSIAMAASQVIPSFAGTWQNGQKGWSYIADDGKQVLGWVQTPSGWYYIDSKDGVMKTGWQQGTDGSWFFLSTANDGSQGAMLTGWCWIDGYCYYFDPQSGKMAKDITTPDGHQINSEGKWVKDGVAVFEAGKGFGAVAATKDMSKTAAKKSKGGSGGGSRGGSGGGSSKRSHGGSNSTGKDDTDTSKPSTEADKSAKEQSNAENSTSDSGKSKSENRAENKSNENETKGTENRTAENKGGEAETKGTESTEDKTAENKKGAGEDSKTEESKENKPENKVEDKTEDGKTEADKDKFAYVNYTKNVKIDFGEYVVVTFKYGTVEDYKVSVDGIDITADMTNVDDDGHVVKWLSTVANPSALQITKKSDNETQDIVLAGGNKKNITKTALQAPKYVISNGPITKFDYYLETYDEEGKVRKDASKTTFTLQKKKTDSKTLSVPSQYYIPVTEIDDEGHGNILIKLLLENEEQEKWFKGLNNIKFLDEENNIINQGMVYTTSTENKFGNVGVINIPLPQSNAYNRGDYYVSIGSANGNSRIRLPISLVTKTNFKVMRDSTTVNPKVGDDIRFKIVDPEGKHSFGSDLKLVMYKVTLTKPDGSIITLPKYDGWYNIAEILHISGTNKKTNEVYTDVPGVYTATIYATGYKTMIKRFEVLKSDGSSVGNIGADEESKNIDSISSPTVSKTHSGNREMSNEVLPGGYSAGNKVKADAISAATKKGGGSSSDATSSASGSLMMNAYLVYDYDLLANAMILNSIGMRSAESDAVMKWWFNQTPEALVGEDKEKLYILNNFVDAYNDARLEGKTLSFEDYINSADAKTRNIVGNVKNVLENGKLGTVYRYGNIVGKAAPQFSPLIQPKADKYTITTENTDFIENLKSIVVDGSSEALRNDSYIKQYEISADKKSITIYENAFNKYMNPIVGSHKISLDAQGYEKFTLELTITDTLEDVELQNESEKLETDSPVVLKAVKSGDSKEGDFIKKLSKVQIQTPEGILKEVYSRDAGGYYSDSVYDIKDGKITLGKGLFKTAGEYIIYVQAQGYPVKSIKLTLTAKPETPNEEPKPPVVEDAKAPKIKSVEKKKIFFSDCSKFVIRFEGMDTVELEKYLNAVEEVSLNGVDYAKVNTLGFGKDNEFYVHADEAFGGEKSQLSIKGEFTESKYDVIVKAKGYEALSFTLNADGSIGEKETQPNKPDKPKEEEPNPPAAEGEKTPKVQKAEKENSFLYSKYIIKFTGMDSSKLEKYLNAVEEVSVNGKAYSKVSTLGFGKDPEFYTHSDAVYGGKKSQLSIKGEFTESKYDITVKAKGYEDLSFTINADGSISEKETQPKEAEEGKHTNIAVDKVEATKVNQADAYAITLKGDGQKVSEFLEKLTAIEVNGEEVKKGTISMLSRDAFMLSGSVIYVKSDKFKGRGDNVVLKSEGFDDISYTTSSKLPTPDMVKAEVRNGSGSSKYVRAAFDTTVRPVLKNFMTEMKNGDVKVTVNGEEYSRGTRLKSGHTFKVSQNIAYGRDEYIDFSLDGFNQENNEVEISSDKFETIKFDVKVEGNAATAAFSSMLSGDLIIKGMNALLNTAPKNIKSATSSNARK